MKNITHWKRINIQYWNASEYSGGKMSKAKTIRPAFVMTATLTKIDKTGYLWRKEIIDVIAGWVSTEELHINGPICTNHAIFRSYLSIVDSTLQLSFVPGSNILTALGERSLMDVHHLPRIATHFNIVADQSEEGSQRQRRGEKSFESKSNHHFWIVSNVWF